MKDISAADSSFNMTSKGASPFRRINSRLSPDNRN
jgi:hypothetical protein